MRTRTMTLVMGAAVLGPAAYLALGRKRCLTWGATPEEIGMEMPGDDLLPNPTSLNPRGHDQRPAGCGVALARPDGPRPRGRLHLRLDREPARPRHAQRRRDLAAVPGPEAGRRSPARRHGPLLRAEVFEPERRWPFAPRTTTGCGRSRWFPPKWPDQAAEQEPDRRPPHASSRSPRPARSLLVMEPGSLVMERKMLLGIRRRAGARAQSARPSRQAS